MNSKQCGMEQQCWTQEGCTSPSLCFIFPCDCLASNVHDNRESSRSSEDSRAASLTLGPVPITGWQTVTVVRSPRRLMPTRRAPRWADAGLSVNSSEKLVTLIRDAQSNCSSVAHWPPLQTSGFEAQPSFP